MGWIVISSLTTLTKLNGNSHPWLVLWFPVAIVPQWTDQKHVAVSLFRVVVKTQILATQPIANIASSNKGRGKWALMAVCHGK